MPVKRRKSQTLIFLFLILTILILDQWTKFLVRIRLAVGESIPVINQALHITFVRNTGAAFGLFKHSTSIFIIISIAAIVVIAAIIIRSIKKDIFQTATALNLGLVLIVSGALGNLIDRVRFGYVIDFIDVRVWPVFNIADSSITIGTFLLIWSALLDKK